MKFHHFSPTKIATCTKKNNLKFYYIDEQVTFYKILISRIKVQVVSLPPFPVNVLIS